MKLLLAAFPPELGSMLEHPPEGWIAVCTGIGAVPAAVSTTRLIRELLPTEVVFVGTCGSYDSRVPLGSLVSVSEVISSSVEELEGNSYRPSLECARWATQIQLPFPAHSVATPPAITATLEGAEVLSRIAPLEHLELSGVMEACREADVPCGAALVVVNQVGPMAHQQWKANHAEGSARLIEALVKAGVFAPGP
jgi:purine-nucleoside phosphorylase